MGKIWRDFGHAFSFASSSSRGMYPSPSYLIVNNVLVGVREDSLILHRVQPLLLVPDGVGVRLEVDCAAHILPAFQNAHNSAVLPRIGEIPAAGEPTISMTALLELLKDADPEMKAKLRLALLT